MNSTLNRGYDISIKTPQHLLLPASCYWLKLCWNSLWTMLVAQQAASRRRSSRSAVGLLGER